jgi:hypothetical protein
VQRRTLLRRGLGALGVATVGSLAGCQADETGDAGDDGGDGTTTDGDTNGPSWATWLFDPTALVDTQVHGFATYDVADLLSYREETPAEVDDGIDQLFGQIEYLSADDLDRVGVQGFGQATFGGGGSTSTPVGWNGVATGSFDTEAVAAELEASELYAAAGEYGGFRLFEGPPEDDSVSSGVGVGSEAVLGGGAVEYDLSATAVVESAIDADAGDADRYYGAGDTVAALMDRHGDATTAMGAADPEGAYAALLGSTQDVGEYEAVLSAARGLGRSTTLGEDTTDTSVSMQFEGEGEEFVEDVRAAVDEAQTQRGQETGPFTEWDVSADGDAVVVSSSADTGAALGSPEGLAFVAPETAVVGAFVLNIGGSESQEAAPQAIFDYERRSDGRVVVTHSGGDSIERLAVVYVVDGERYADSWAPEGGITAGTSVTTSQAPDGGSTLRVVWESEGQSSVLGEYTVPRN